MSGGFPQKYMLSQKNNTLAVHRHPVAKGGKQLWKRKLKT